LKLQADLLKARTTFAGLDSFLQQNLSQRQSKQDEINRLLEFDNKLREMDREIEVASKSLATLKEKEEQSRVIEGLRQQRISSVSVAQPPSFVEKPVSPKKPVLALGFVSLGCLMGVGLTYLREFTRKTIRRPEEVERMLKYPVLTEVADLRALSQARETNEQTLRSRRCGRLLEACQGIQSELMLNLVKSDDSLRQARRIGVIGVTDGCGASSIAMALAMACADHDGQTTTLIDLDAKKGTVSKGFGLAHNTDSGRTRRRVNPDSLPAQRLTEDGLNLIGCKSQPGLVLAQGDAEGITRTLDELGRSSEFIIIDFPPANRFSNSLAVAQQLDQIIVVIASDQTEAKPAMKLIQQLEHAKADVVGVVVNKSKRYVARWIEGILG
jgi:tyrosine-protein kinase Etk/Wzc